jgi:hypothetical protein
MNFCERAWKQIFPLTVPLYSTVVCTKQSCVKTRLVPQKVFEFDHGGISTIFISPMPHASELRSVVDNTFSTLLGDESASDGASSSPPKPIKLVMGYIMKLIEHLKKKGSVLLPKTDHFQASMEQYRRFFGDRDIVFMIPKEHVLGSVSPWYHSIESSQIFIIDWQVSHPNHQLCCPLCNVEMLQHDRFNFTKNGTLFPVFRKSGFVMWGAVMQYKCKRCNVNIPGNSGIILNSLPAHIRQAYPVEPQFATGSFHLATEISDDLDSMMKTYCNAEYISRHLHLAQAKRYERAIENFMSLSPSASYPSFPEFIGIYPPSGRAIRELFDKAERSTFTVTGVSNFSRYNREIQSVGTTGAVAIDHTFAVVKNYNVPGAKACFTMMTSTHEIAAAALVGTTSVDQISHLCEQVVRRRDNFQPKVIYTDTWPHNNEFWTTIFGIFVVGRLGLFHCMKRIVDTLNPRCCYYWKALWDLKMCFYQYRASDMEALLHTC